MSRLSDQVTGWALAATGGVLAIAAVATVLLFSAGSAAGASAATVNARHTSLGTILVDAKGDTLYAFSRDRRNHDACAAVKGCLAEWPMLTVRGRPVAGRGVKSSLLSTITVNGVRQVTYAGHPLYRFADDDGPGSTGYVGESQSGGTWPAVAPSGKLIH